MRILLVEDDAMLGESLERALRDRGMSVDWTRDGDSAQSALERHAYSLSLLDLGLPGRSGLEVLQHARKIGLHTPFIVITARDSRASVVASLDLGADDYVTKPFEVEELAARMRAVIRRHDGHAASIITNGEITLDVASHEAAYRGVTHALSAKEFALLHALLQRPGAILSRTQLEERLYGWNEPVASNAVEVLIHYLRRKFGQDIIRNVRGVGWLVGKRT